MTEHAGVVRITTLTTDEGRRDRLVAELLRHSEDVRQAQGCFGAQVCSVEDRPDAVAVVSRWRSRADMDSFLSSNAQGITEVLDGLLTRAPESVHFTSLSPARDQAGGSTSGTS